MPLTKLKLHSPFALVVIAFTLIAFNLTMRDALTQIVYLASSTQRSHSDVGGQTASPNPSGFDQEKKVRRMLAKQYDKLYSDEASIRNFLNMRGNTADFLGHNSATHRWLIAESKASNIGHAWEQLQNTTQAFVKANPGANFELRLYLDAKHYEIVASGGRIGNWGMNNGLLGWFNADEEFVVAVVERVKILVLAAP